MTLEVSNSRQPEPKKNSVLKEYGLDFLEHFAPGKQAPDDAKVMLLHNELIRVGVSDKSLSSLQVGQPRAIYSSTSFSNEEVLTGHSLNANIERYFLYFHDFRTSPFVLIASKAVSSKDVLVKYFDNGEKFDLDEQKAAREVYKILSALHDKSQLGFESLGAHKPYT